MRPSSAGSAPASMTIWSSRSIWMSCCCVWNAHIASSKRLVIGALTLDAEEHSAYLNKEEIGLTVREFNLIYKLLSYPKKTFTRSQLMDEFWDSSTSAGS